MELNLLTVIVSSITGFLTFLLGQQRGKKEVENLHLQNLEQSITIYKTIIDDLRKEITILNKKVGDLQDMVDDLMVENQKLQKMIKSEK